MSLTRADFYTPEVTVASLTSTFGYHHGEHTESRNNHGSTAPDASTQQTR